jgi:SWI/SNF-related matrix-associated actin-dependent regulator 1 of chromatin subfamily A
MKQYKAAKGKLEVKFQLPGKDFTDTLSFIKTITGRKWDVTNKLWTVPDTPEVKELLGKNGFLPVGESVPEVPMEIPQKVIAQIDKSLLHKDLHEYQVEGVGFLVGVGGSGILSWSVGCGKSLAALSFCIANKDNFPALVLCPASLRENWCREIKKWYKKSSIKLSGRQAHPIRTSPFVIINYDILGDPADTTSWAYSLAKHKFQTIIADESHLLKNVKAKRTKAFLALSKTIKNRIFLSGTIIKNRTSDLFVPLHSVAPTVFPNQYKFLHRYCDPKYTPWGYTYKGLTNENELKALMAPYVHSVKKRDVLSDLPDRMINTVAMDTDNSTMKKYTKATAAFIEWANSTAKKKQVEKNSHMEVLRALCYQMKRESVIDWIENFLDNEEKLIAFCIHTAVIDDLREHFKGISVVVDGRVTGDRMVMVDKFTNDPECRLFIGQVDAAGMGLNLHVASNVCMVEMPYVLSSIEQCFGRVDRLGQKADKVSLWHLFAPDTIEEDIAIILEEKREIVDTLLNNGVKSDIFGMDINDLIMGKFEEKR